MIFKIWAGDRTKKIFVTIKEEEDICNKLIIKASEKLQIPGHVIVLESDGTQIDDDEVLQTFANETLLLLRDNEHWAPLQYTTARTSVSVASTETVSNSNTNCSEIEEVGKNNTADFTIVHTTDANLENFWSEYCVPWENIPKYMLEAADVANQRKTTIVSEIVRIVVHDMRKLKSNISSKTFKKVALQMAGKYPDIFKDIDDDGIVLGDGAHSLARKLLDRNNYLNRPFKRGGEDMSTLQPAKARKLANVNVGCSNWQPTMSRDDMSCDIHLVNNTEEENAEFLALLEKTYPSMRHFINLKVPTMEDIQLHWPVLLKSQCILWHFKKLTSINVDDVVESIKNKVKRLHKYGQKQKRKDNHYQSTDGDFLTSIKVIGFHFKETLEFIVEVPVEDNTAEWEKKIITNGPTLVILKGVDIDTCAVYYEKQKINEDSYDTVRGFFIMFALYFIFNIKYPKEVSLTLETIQRYFLKIHPESGSKSNKNITSKRRVLNFLSKIRNID